MYCHLNSYPCTRCGTRILPESQNLWQYPKAAILYLTSQIVMEAFVGSLEGSEIISPTVIFTSSNTKAEIQVLKQLLL